MDSFAQRLASVRERIRRAAERAARAGGGGVRDVRLVGVSKTVPAERLVEAIAAGLLDLGESRMQEAEPKLEAVAAQAARAPTWHFVGHVQTNKARRVAASFDWVHGVDSPRLAQALDRHAAELGRRPRVLIEVNVAGEHQKAGVAVADAEALVDEVARCAHLALRGFMTVGPRVDRPADARAAFRTLAALAARMRARRPELELDQLSMGMSGDFELAIEEGATMVRVGSALFGARD